MSDDVPMEGVEDTAMAVDSDDEMAEAAAPPAAPAPAAAAAPPAGAAGPGGSAPPGPPGPAVPPEPAPETDAATAKRRAIQAIMRDASLPDVDRRRRIQTLMDGTAEATPEARSAPGGSGSTEGLLAGAAAAAAASAAGSAGEGAAGGGGSAGGAGAGIGSGLAGGPPEQLNADEAISCVHYERRCNIVAPCCNKIFGCRVCHDEMTPPPGHGAMDRFAVREIVCKDCKTRQPTGNRCANPNCAIQFGEYHCDICNLWMVQSKRPFHCTDCGFCRVGGRESFRHCDRCCMCISVNVYDDHNCMKDKYKNNCPVCREDMFSSRQSPQDLPCGHAIHAHCFRKLAGFDYRCPICKKTVVSQQSMAAAWATRARDIEMQPMPSDLARVVNIMCNDCETRSENRNWHFLGVQCPHCTSFNTVVEQVVSSGDAGAAAANGEGNVPPGAPAANGGGPGAAAPGAPPPPAAP